MALSSTERSRNHRARKAALANVGDDPVSAVAAWSESTLIVPPGHPLAGQPMALPAYAVDWLRASLAPGIRESLLTMARKNAKSAVCAVLALAYVAGRCAALVFAAQSARSILRRPASSSASAKKSRKRAG